MPRRTLATALVAITCAQSSLAAEPGNEAAVQAVLNRAIRPISSLSPAAASDLRSLASNRYLTPLVAATDQCAEFYSADGRMLCSSPMVSYEGTFRISQNSIAVRIADRTRITRFYKGADGKLFAALANAHTQMAIEVLFYRENEDVPVRFWR